jgi:DNA modification methylase
MVSRARTVSGFFLLQASWGDPRDMKLQKMKIADLTPHPESQLDWLSAMNVTLDDETAHGDPDEIPEMDEESDPITQPGDLWQLGQHRLLCGDSTNPEDVARLMQDDKADMCFTSPPYNAHTARNIEGEKKPLYIDNSIDNKTSLEYIEFNKNIFDSMVEIGNDSFTILYNLSYNKNAPFEFIDIVYNAKKVIPLRETVIWEKSIAISLHGNNLTRIVEFIFIFSKDDLKINKNQTECVKNLWKINNIGANTKDHKACFPVDLAIKGINLFSSKGDIVVDPFGGSGTTLIACEELGRQARLMEIIPKYCDDIVSRFETYTGQTAVKL